MTLEATYNLPLLILDLAREGEDDVLWDSVATVRENSHRHEATGLGSVPPVVDVVSGSLGSGHCWRQLASCDDSGTSFLNNSDKFVLQVSSIDEVSNRLAIGCSVSNVWELGCYKRNQLAPKRNAKYRILPEWLPQMIKFWTLEMSVPSFWAIWARARFWSRRVIAVKFSRGMVGA